jgi:hypothetical protein
VQRRGRRESRRPWRSTWCRSCSTPPRRYRSLRHRSAGHAASSTGSAVRIAVRFDRKMVLTAARRPLPLPPTASWVPATRALDEVAVGLYDDDCRDGTDGAERDGTASTAPVTAGHSPAAACRAHASDVLVSLVGLPARAGRAGTAMTRTKGSAAVPARRQPASMRSNTTCSS